MSLDEIYSPGDQPAKPTQDAKVRGKRPNPLAVIPSGLLCVMLVYQVTTQSAGWLIVMLFPVGMAFIATLAALVRPPDITLRKGMFAVRFGLFRVCCPGSEVAELRLEERCLRVTFKSLNRVEPSNHRETMAQCMKRNGFHFAQAGGTYTLQHVNELRSALGFPPQEADLAGEQIERFQAGVKAQTSVVTVSMMAACIAVFLIQIACRSAFPNLKLSDVAWGANWGPKTLTGDWWRLITYMFLHGGLFHLVLNMWVLWDVGRVIEKLIGHAATALLYVLAGVAGGMASLAWHPQVILVGASGAIFGLVGALFGLLCHARSAVPPAMLTGLLRSISAFVLFNLVFGLTMPGIDIAAHVGGLVAGVVGGLILAPAGTKTHRMRLGWLAIGGTIALFGSTHYLPPVPPDIQGEFEKLAQGEQQILQRYAELCKQAQQGRLSEQQLADQIEVDVIMPWRTLRQQVCGWKDQLSNQLIAKRLGEYMQLRQESWEEFAVSIRDRDMARRQSAEKKWAAAESVTRESTGSASNRPR